MSIVSRWPRRLPASWPVTSGTREVISNCPLVLSTDEATPLSTASGFEALTTREALGRWSKPKEQ